MKRIPALALAVVLPVLVGWVDYGTTVEREEPVFGKEFQGISLRIQTANVEFEQDMPEEIVVHLRNSTDRTRLTMQEPGEGRRFALYLVVADEEGNSLFSRNLLDPLPENIFARERIPPQASCELIRVPYNRLEVAKVETYLDGLPHFEEGQRLTNAGWMRPRIYHLKAVLLSTLPDQRPDFVAASEVWRILLRPKSAERMAADEKGRLMERYLARMGEGAYGGVGVSAQLAALGEDAVAPLIEMAERTGGEDEAAKARIRESRIWAIVTLCNTGSKRAEDYILERLHDPIDFGDLAFLAWHCQGFRSPRVTAAARQLAEDIASGRELPWERRHGPESRRHGMGCFEFLCKHFISIKHSITEATMAGALEFPSPELTGYALMAWQPADGEQALRVLRPLFRRGDIHPNLRRLAVAKLAPFHAGQGFPAYVREATPDEQEQAWLDAALWLQRNGRLDEGEILHFLRRFALAIRKENTVGQRDLMLALRRFGAGAGYPVASGRIDPVADWVRTWQWALRESDLPAREAADFLCRQMRTREEIPDVVRRALLFELKRVLGEEFPLASATPEDIDLAEAWPACGQWLVEQGYFGQGR